MTGRLTYSRRRCMMSGMNSSFQIPDPGKTLIYHIGDLATDRERNAELAKHADALWAASERGEVVLSQQRYGRLTSYRATGVRRFRALPDGVKHVELAR